MTPHGCRPPLGRMSKALPKLAAHPRLAQPSVSLRQPRQAWDACCLLWRWLLAGPTTAGGSRCSFRAGGPGGSVSRSGERAPEAVKPRWGVQGPVPRPPQWAGATPSPSLLAGDPLCRVCVSTRMCVDIYVQVCMSVCVCVHVREQLSLTEHSQLLQLLLLFSDPFLSVPAALPQEVGVVFSPVMLRKCRERRRHLALSIQRTEREFTSGL